MNNYDKNKESSSYLKYWEVDNLYGWAMLHKLPENGLKWVQNLSEFDKGFIKGYNEKSKEGYFLETDVQYKNEYVIHMKNLEETLNHGLVFKFNQKAWLKSYIEMNS